MSAPAPARLYSRSQHSTSHSKRVRNRNRFWRITVTIWPQRMTGPRDCRAGRGQAANHFRFRAMTARIRQAMTQCRAPRWQITFTSARPMSLIGTKLSRNGPGVVRNHKNMVNALELNRGLTSLCDANGSGTVLPSFCRTLEQGARDVGKNGLGETLCLHMWRRNHRRRRSSCGRKSASSSCDHQDGEGQAGPHLPR